MQYQKQKNILESVTEKTASRILWIFISIYVLGFFLISFLKFNYLAYNDYDLAYFDQIAWNLLHGTIYSSILGMSFLGVHVQTIWFLIAPIYAIFPHPLTLLFLQSFALGIAAYPLYLLAKQILGHRWGLLISFIYLTYPAIGHMNLYEFHVTAFAPVFLLSMFYFFHKERFGLFMLFLFLAVFCQENVSLATFGMGFYALYRRRRLKWVIVPLLAGGIYFLLCIKVILPYFNKDTVKFSFLYSHLGDSFSQIVVNMLKHPLYVLRFMFSPPKVTFLLQLFGPICFLPFLSPGLLLSVFPLFAQHLLSSRPSQTMIYYHYTAEIVPFIFVAFVFGIKNLLNVKKFMQHRFYLWIVLLFVSVGSTFLLGPHFRLPRIAQEIYRRDAKMLEIKKNLLKKIPLDASIVATFEFLPHLTHYRELYSFHHHYMGLYSLSSRPYRLPDTVNYALLDFNDGLTFGSFYSPKNYKNIQELLNRGKWGVLDVKDNIVLFEKNAENKYVLYDILLADPKPEHSYNVKVKGEVEFLGFDIKDDGRRNLHLTFYWKSLVETQKDYNIFIDLIDSSGTVVYRIFRPICYRIYPTNAWASGQLIKEEAYLTVPSYAVCGRYRLEIGFFDFASKQMSMANPKDSFGRIFLSEIVLP